MMAIYIIGATLFAFAVSNLHAWAKAINSIFFSQGKHLRRVMSNTETTMLTHLFAEVDLMAEMVKVSSKLFHVKQAKIKQKCHGSGISKYITFSVSVWTLSPVNKVVWSALSTLWTLATPNGRSAC
jgi:hypothetical protein